MSSVHRTGVETIAPFAFNAGMAESAKALAARLKMTREALGLKPVEICKRIGVGPTAWSMYESGERRITLAVANKLCDEFGLSLDWIYRANPAQLPHAIRMKMRQVA